LNSNFRKTREIHISGSHCCYNTRHFWHRNILLLLSRQRDEIERIFYPKKFNRLANVWTRDTESGARACGPVTERILMAMMGLRRLPDAVCRSRAPLYCYILLTLLSRQQYIILYGDDNLLCVVTMVITTLTAASVKSVSTRCDLLY